MFRYSLRTLLLLTILVPPLLWGVYLLVKPPGVLFWIGVSLLAFLVCIPYAIIRLSMIRRK